MMRTFQDIEHPYKIEVLNQVRSTIADSFFGMITINEEYDRQRNLLSLEPGF